MSSNRPNIVIIMTDQQRADLCRREGYALDTTPFLDSLAAGGTWFNRAYTTMPVCVSARISMLTGRYPSAHSVRINYNHTDATFTTDMMQMFRSQGYRTALSGKNHTYLTKKDVDFWYQAGHSSADDAKGNAQYEAFARHLDPMHMHMWPTPTPFPVECHIPYRIVTKAEEFVDSCGQSPFFLWMSFPEPHNPSHVPEPYFDMFPPDSLPPLSSKPDAWASKGFAWKWCRQAFDTAFPGFEKTIGRIRSNYHGMLRLIDDQVKRFAQFLSDRGLSENTIVFFLSDHGDFVGEYGLVRKGPELPELLTRISLIVSGPGVARQKGPRNAHVSLADIFPTVCEAVGAEIPDGVQGRSLWPMLSGQAYPKDEFRSAFAELGFGGLPYDGSETLDPAKDGLIPEGDFGRYDCLNSRTQSGTLRMVRKGDWKLLLDVLGRGQLYNLKNDPVELRNLYDDPSAAAARADLTAELALWLLRTQDPLPMPKPNASGRIYVMKRRPHNYWCD